MPVLRSTVLLVVALPLASASAHADISAMGSAVTKTTTKGDVVGRLDGGLERYFGIPTAADASAANRFKAPAAVSAWGTPLQTTAEKICAHMGAPGPNGEAPSFIGSEDCISVDVITPAGASGLPVYVYVHGGGFTMQDPLYSKVTSGYYSKDAKAVSVFVHYRLGALGFMAHAGLSAETAYSGSGNWGLLDVIAGLQWVKDNIASFGGDPTKVTLAGESAGATIAMQLSASPLAAGLFSQVLAQSPYMGGNLKAGSYGMAARYEMASMFVSATGCSEGATAATVAPPADATAATNEVTCLRAAPVASLYAGAALGAATAFDAVYGAGAAGLVGYNSIQSWPVVDGHVLTQPPLDAWTAGVGAGTKFLIGMNKDEYTLFYPSPMTDYATASFKGAVPYADADHAFVLGMDGLSLTSTLKQWLASIRAAASAPTPAADAAYTEIGATYPRAVQTSTDAWFAAPLRLIVGTLVAQSGRATGTVFKYLFAQDPSATVTSMLSGALKHMGACHGCELTYTLGWYEAGNSYLGYDQSTPHTFSAAEKAMGATMRTFWLNFLTTGDPGTVGGTTWKANTMVEFPHTMVFKAALSSDGAALDPCLNTEPCKVEASNDYRVAISRKWIDPSASLPWATDYATSCGVAADGAGPTQAAMGYTCGLPVLTGVCLGLGGFALVVVLSWSLLLGLKNAAASKGTTGAKVSLPAKKDVKSPVQAL